MTLLGKPQWDNAILAYLVPPREDLPFQSPRILIFTRSVPSIIHKEGFSLPGQIFHDKEIMARELADPDHLPCVVVQLDEDRQFMYFAIEDCIPEIHRILNARIDEVEDRAIVPGYDQNNPPSPLILPGTSITPPPGLGGKLIIPGQTPANVGGYSGDEIWRIEMDWQIPEETDLELIARVRSIATGIKI